MKLTFAYSPCPNDTFMFEPLISNRVDTEGLQFEIILDDVEALNKSAIEEQYDITKLSFNAYVGLTEKYQLLNSGSALGRNCGPLLIAKKELSLQELQNGKIGIPGVHTTANFLLSYVYPDLSNKKEYLFSEIESAIVSGDIDAGVIIHENRFTYQNSGLVKIVDLGEYWENKTGFPIPLGGIVTRRDFSKDLKQKIDRVIARSVKYALLSPQSGMDYIRSHAQEMDDSVMQSHILLYVNNFSANIGIEGRKSVEFLFDSHPDKRWDKSLPLFISQEKEENGSSDFLEESYWSSRYQNDKSGWDVGGITTPLKEYIDQLIDKNIAILIPGCGNSHEAEYLHEQGFTNVKVCDLSQEPLENLLKRCPSFPKKNLIHGDFFDMVENFDLILEQTFFCAIHPSLREKYISKVSSMLHSGGKIAGLKFGIEFPFAGPPFGGSMEEYKALYSIDFNIKTMEGCYNSIEPRAGKEIFFICQKK